MNKTFRLEIKVNFNGLKEKKIKWKINGKSYSLLFGSKKKKKNQTLRRKMLIFQDLNYRSKLNALEAIDILKLGTLPHDDC